MTRNVCAQSLLLRYYRSSVLSDAYTPKIFSLLRFENLLDTSNLLPTRDFHRFYYTLSSIGIDLFIIEETNIILSRNRMNHDRDRISMNKSHANNERPVSSQTRHFIRGDRIGIGVFLAKDSELTLEGSTD